MFSLCGGRRRLSLGSDDPSIFHQCVSDNNKQTHGCSSETTTTVNCIQVAHDDRPDRCHLHDDDDSASPFIIPRNSGRSPDANTGAVGRCFGCCRQNRHGLVECLLEHFQNGTDLGTRYHWGAAPIGRHWSNVGTLHCPIYRWCVCVLYIVYSFLREFVGL